MVHQSFLKVTVLQSGENRKIDLYSDYMEKAYRSLSKQS